MVIQSNVLTPRLDKIGTPSRKNALNKSVEIFEQKLNLPRINNSTTMASSVLNHGDVTTKNNPQVSGYKIKQTPLDFNHEETSTEIKLDENDRTMLV